MQTKQLARMMGALGVLVSCGGRHEVGSHPTELGVGGASGGSSIMTQVGSGGTGTGMSAGGAAGAGAGTSSGMDGSSMGVGGSNQGGAGGGPPSMSRCEFPEMPPTPFTHDPVRAWDRLTKFLGDGAVEPPVNAGTPEWIGEMAIKILDSWTASGSAPGGLVRFMSKWGRPSEPSISFLRAATWAYRLVPPSATLADLLATPGPGDSPPRIGILADQEWLTVRPSIGARGIWMSNRLFCRVVPPSPADVMTSPPVPGPGETRRQAHQRTLSQPACSGCHQLIDPLGYSLEHFDAQGNYRVEDNGQPVNSAAEYFASSRFVFTSIQDLAPQLSQSCEVARCFTQALLADALDKELDQPVDEADVNRIANAFADSGFSMRALIRATVLSPSFLR